MIDVKKKSILTEGSLCFIRISGYSMNGKKTLIAMSNLEPDGVRFFEYINETECMAVECMELIHCDFDALVAGITVLMNPDNKVMNIGTFFCEPEYEYLKPVIWEWINRHAAFYGWFTVFTGPEKNMHEDGAVLEETAMGKKGIWNI